MHVGLQDKTFFVFIGNLHAGLIKWCWFVCFALNLHVRPAVVATGFLLRASKLAPQFRMLSLETHNMVLKQ